MAAGIARERLIFDPGIGFSKNAEQSWQIIEHVETLAEAGFPLLIGHSRKSFLTSRHASLRRDHITLEVSRQLIASGVDYLRVHDVAAHRALIEELHG